MENMENRPCYNKKKQESKPDLPEREGTCNKCGELLLGGYVGLFINGFCVTVEQTVTVCFLFLHGYLWSICT